MRTAEDIISIHCPIKDYYGFVEIRYAINDARKEVIEECAQIAKDYAFPDAKIMSLINELK